MIEVTLHAIEKRKGYLINPETMSNPYGKSEIDFSVLHTINMRSKIQKRIFRRKYNKISLCSLEWIFKKIKPRKALIIKGEIDKFDYSNIKNLSLSNKNREVF